MPARSRPKPRRQLHLVFSLPQAFLCLAVLASVVLWSGAVTGYVLFRDDVLAEFASRHVAMQRGYEERLAESRALLADARRNMGHAETTHQAERMRLVARMDRLIEIHAQLEERQMMLAETLGVSDEQGGAASARPAAGGPSRPTPLGQTPAPMPQPKPRLSTASAMGGAGPALAMADMVEQRFNSAIAVLGRVEHGQVMALAMLENDARSRRDALSAIYAKAGVALDEDTNAMGGPFIAAGVTGETFEQHLRRISHQRDAADELHQGLKALPLRSPMMNARMTSHYGTRMDPFLGRPAFHAGVDFRAKTGSPVHATAAGIVTASGANGGYGIMIDVEHEHGLATRYAHLSRTLVTEGEAVEAGQLIGYSGSTGRSTGPHLHYETRRDGEPEDPRRLLSLGRSLPADLLD